MFGIKEDLIQPLPEIADCVIYDVEVFLEAYPQGMFYMKIPGLAEDSGNSGLCGKDGFYVAVVFHLDSCPVGTAEGHNSGILQVQLPCLSEIAGILWIGPGKAAFNVMDAELIEFLCNP